MAHTWNGSEGNDTKAAKKTAHFWGPFPTYDWEPWIMNGKGGDDHLTGSPRADQINGGPGNDWLYGGHNDPGTFDTDVFDILDGGPGADWMYGGHDNDIYKVDNIGDVVVEYFNEGIDQVDSTINYTLGSNVENLRLLGAFAETGTGNSLNNRIEGNQYRNYLHGEGGSDTIIGHGGDDNLFGGANNDYLFGDAQFGNIGAGNDHLNGGLGADHMTGGSGNDSYSVENTGDKVIEYLNQGNDQVYSYLYDYTLPVNVEELFVLGSGINGRGNVLNNKIYGNTYNNRLHGSIGNDTLLGYAGNDNLYGDSNNDSLNGGTGDDQLFGVNTLSSVAGFNEVDYLTGDSGKDNFWLGDINYVYYDSSDRTDIVDWAYITDFNLGEDKIVLHGSASDYTVAYSSAWSGSLISLLVDGETELIGVVQNVSLTTSDLNDDSIFTLL